jgi:formate dehydrogenase subunit gamma
VTGIALVFPFSFTDVFGMQDAQLIHSVVALVFIAIIIGHIYIGTLGMVGAFDAMGSGKVDKNWAKEHHSVWFEELEKGGTSNK